MKTINLKPAIGIILFFSFVLLITVSCKKEKSVFALADFSFSGNTIALPAVVQFTNKSFGLSYVWDFGDGSSSKAESPSHTYTQFGLYKVKLIVQGTNNIDSMVQEILVGGSLGQITELNCAAAQTNRVIKIVDVLNQHPVLVPYTGGNAGVYSGQTISSTGVAGLTATLTAGSFANGSGNLEYKLTGMPQSFGQAKFNLNVGGRSCELSIAVLDSGESLPRNGLIGWWPFNNNANDESGNNHELTPIGLVLKTENRFGQANSAYYFSTVVPESKFNFPSSFNSVFNQLSLGTISFWVKIDSIAEHDHYFGFDNVFFAKQTHGVNTETHIGLANNKFRIHSGPLPSSVFVVDTTTIRVKTWYSLIITWTPNLLRFFVNGQLSSEIQGSFGLSNNPSPSFTSIGGFQGTGGSGCYSSIDDIGFWNRALTNQEIAMIFNASR